MSECAGDDSLIENGEEIQALARKIATLCVAESKSTHVIIYAQICAVAASVVAAAKPKAEFTAITETGQRYNEIALHFLHCRIAEEAEKS